jgi:hypothetical protein
MNPEGIRLPFRFAQFVHYQKNSFPRYSLRTDLVTRAIRRRYSSLNVCTLLQTSSYLGQISRSLFLRRGPITQTACTRNRKVSTFLIVDTWCSRVFHHIGSKHGGPTTTMPFYSRCAHFRVLFLSLPISFNFYIACSSVSS